MTIRTICRRLRATTAAACVLAGAGAAAQPADVGRLLYDTHCIECHTAQMHWRANRAARDWDGLRAQVRRWQGQLQLRWSDAEVDAVARYLNETIYHHPQPGAVARAAGR